MGHYDPYLKSKTKHKLQWYLFWPLLLLDQEYSDKILPKLRNSSEK